ncbi:N-glycosylase/DNA lyase [archaeon]|jgi:N-glycosylase/DNA lyase|nr:N-glycosylase/DNA lyase [archaeon]MBT4352246.1 N-glycosylase/DNA lyase [archaeon]MBT4647162.1 N-glycosylase/DNA lyase [archaeon]MBT6822165.1 N-glycosylase/DNA lyase [archaeon]MBT7391760.1 N-glycosylase/DNA lyase [archaeon]
MQIKILKKKYQIKKDDIQKRLNEFKNSHLENKSWFYEDKKMILKKIELSRDQIIFEELCFCLLTANTSAVMGMKGIDKVRPFLLNGKYENIRDALVSSGYRFPNKRAEYIIEARKKLSDEINLELKKHIDSFQNSIDAREYFVTVKGLAYKEASHFLRNVGYFGITILDKHILRTLHEYGVISEVPKSLNKKRYLEIESKFIKFCQDVNIDMDEMDLLLWSMKNGNIMK